MLSTSFVLVFSTLPPDAASYHLYFSPVNAPEANNVAVDPMQIEAPVVVGIAGIELIEIFTPLSDPMIDGSLLITRIL